MKIIVKDELDLAMEHAHAGLVELISATPKLNKNVQQLQELFRNHMIVAEETEVAVSCDLEGTRMELTVVMRSK
jgi:hypothetical protein